MKNFDTTILYGSEQSKFRNRHNQNAIISPLICPGSLPPTGCIENLTLIPWTLRDKAISEMALCTLANAIQYPCTMVTLLLPTSILTIGGPQLTSVCMAVYFTIYTFFYSLFILRNFCSTRAPTTENVIFGVLTLDSLIPTNITSKSVLKIWRHAPDHCTFRRPISSLIQSLHHPQIRHKSFHQKRTSP